MAGRMGNRSAGTATRVNGSDRNFQSSNSHEARKNS